MLKKVIFKILISFLALSSFAKSAESGGMPQLDPEFWISQIFWLILTFGLMFILLSKIILPKISNNLETRKSQILTNIETAEKQRAESEKKIKEYEKIILETKNEANNFFNEARNKVIDDINKKREVLENDINNEIKEAEEEIKKFKNQASEKINKIAIETSTDLLKKIMDTEVNNSSISAIVEDLSKKNKGKYHGI